MDEFGSPIAGGIRAVRRNISSSMLVPRRQNETPQGDPVTSNLLTNQSLQLKTVSRQLEVISNTLTGVNGSLTGISENLALSDRLDRERERANQNRERILAEQGLREGKESALEKKIQNALVSPLRRIGAKAQGVLFNFQKFFLLLAGGWLTNVGIDLINALVSGNTEELEKLKFKFVGGLVAIGGIITLFNTGLKSLFLGLTRFVGLIGRVAFGGILRTVLAGFSLFLKKVAVKAGLAAAGGGFLGGLTGSGFAGGVVGGTAGVSILNRIDRAIKNIKLNFVSGGGLADKAMKDPNFLKAGKDAVLQGMDATPPVKANLSFGDRIRGLLTGGAKKTGTQKLITGTAKEAGKQTTKKLASKGVMGLLKKLAAPLKGKGGFIGSFLIDFLIFGEPFDEALAGAAGFVAGAKAGAALGGFLGAFVGGIGAIPGATIGGIIGGFLGPSVMKGLYGGIKNLFGFGKNEDKEPSDPNQQLTFKDFKLVPEENMSDNVTPVSRNNDKVASNLRENESPEIITLPMGGNISGSSSASNTEVPTPNALPKIAFNTGNPHTLFAVSQTGVA
tara:strand:- start:4809 stop:6494 length:1686 start_codon:yes stop_codon:yes gene_type:complete